MTFSFSRTPKSLIRASVVALAIVSAPLAAQSFAATAAATSIAVQTTAQMQTLSSGEWTKKSFKSSGDWTIYTKDGQTFVELSDDFKTKNAPDLKIFLSPLSASATNGNNATQGAVLIAPLTSNKGGQIYLIPSSVDLNDYESILIHCEAYSKLWSAASL